MGGRYSGDFDETKAILYDLFSTRHNRRVVWYEHLLELGLGLYMMAMMFIIEAAAIPARGFGGWVQKGWGSTLGRVQMPNVSGKILWWVFGGVGAIILFFAVWFVINTLGRYR